LNEGGAPDTIKDPFIHFRLKQSVLTLKIYHLDILHKTLKVLDDFSSYA